MLSLTLIGAEVKHDILCIIKEREVAYYRGAEAGSGGRHLDILSTGWHPCRAIA